MRFRSRKGLHCIDYQALVRAMDITLSIGYFYEFSAQMSKVIDGEFEVEGLYVVFENKEDYDLVRLMYNV